MNIFVRFLIILSLLFAGALQSWAAGLEANKAGPRDKCPVCGMFVARYPDFAAQVKFRDGSQLHFDGAKDLLKYYLNITRYTPARRPGDIAALFVTSYYDLTPIDGFTAFYVAGSDVFGPMGRELIPFAKESEAQEFKKDHKGKNILRFREITGIVLRTLD